MEFDGSLASATSLSSYACCAALQIEKQLHA